MKKEIIGIVAIVVVIIAVAGLYIGTPQPREQMTVTVTTTAYTTTPTTPTATKTVTTPKIEKIKIGIAVPLTGQFANYGKEVLDVETIAVKHVNENGGIQSLGGAKLELIVEDTESTVEGAKLAAQRMLDIHKVPVVTGVFISSHVIAMQPILEGKVIFFPNAMADEITMRGFEYTYRMVPTAKTGGMITAQMVADLQKKYDPDNPIKTVVVLNEDSAFGSWGGIGLIEGAKLQGWKVLFHEEYSRDIKDVVPIMSRIHSAKPDVVLIVPYFTDSVLFARAIKDMGPGARFWAAANETGFTDARSLAELGELANWFTNTYSYDVSKDTYWNKKFVSEFEATYGYTPSGVGAKRYWCTWFLKEALEVAGREYPEDPLNPQNLKKIFDTLQISDPNHPAVQVYPGPHPILGFDSKGDLLYPAMVGWQVIEGKTYVVWPFESAQRDAVYPRPDYTPQ